MSHKISSVTIQNYKSCINTQLLLSGYTPLVGYNNAGKSNSLSAIQWLLRKSTLTEKDFFDENLPVEVEATIDGVTAELMTSITPAHKKSIEPYIENSQLKIKRTQPNPTSSLTEIKLSVWNSISNEWTLNPAGIDNAIKALLPEPIRIGAMENAAEDASKAKTSTTIGKLLAEFLSPVKLAHGTELNTHLMEVNRRISSNGDLRFNELNTIDSCVNTKINDLFPGMSIKLHFDTPSIDDLIKAGTLKVFEEKGDGRDFSSYGHGAQRSIQMALVQHLAEVKRQGGINQSTTLLLIDEPELYLHPFAIEQVREALIKLSENGYQVIISTHSAQMITSDIAEKTLLIRKSNERGTYARLRLLNAIQNIVVSSVHQMEQLFSLTNSTQVLFSEKVILTEGKTELRLLPLIFKEEFNSTLGQNKFALIAQSGVNDTKKSMEILAAMDLPAKAICDLDYGFTGAIRDGFVDQNNPDILAMKDILKTLSTTHLITLNANGLPTKSTTQTQTLKPAKVFELLAKQATAKPHIDSLHNQLKAQGIWLWKLGAIEAHIGTASKDESAWAQFKKNVIANGLSGTCSDYQGVKDLIDWIAA